ncbi:hypothetical protein PVL29_025010 [Vitis rotundifolia]|uniref:Protein kinase domain-containing protein n=1 Tax=Vitis rotundifolia TaxID=103349 RepID=A0AA38YTF6_VITRO|nr:hypothetical protein PVL29_025010 [Vitis rotundifolia]
MGKTERKERKEREKYMLTNGGLLLEKRISYFDGKYSNPIRSFSADELQKATDNYNHENRIFGYTSHFRWYKGCFEGRLIFVKKYMDSFIPTHSRSFLADLEMFANEILVAAQLSEHKSSLKLLGCCLETQIPTLVFEFPMNGNLQDQSNPTCLSWKSRLKIASEIASVITYLHTALPRPIIHRDIHPGHFYLDQDLCAKLSDFIYSMALPEGKTQVENEVACGTLGYLGPEFELFLSITNDFKDDQKEDYPMAPIQSYVRNHGINGIVDPKILAEGGGVYHHHQFQAVFQLGLKCCRMNQEERPIILDVAKQLRRIQRYVSSLLS